MVLTSKKHLIGDSDYLDLLGKKIHVVVDRPIGSSHPTYGYIYPLNYGYCPDYYAGDAEPVDVYILDKRKMEMYQGIVVAIIKRKNDNENKLVVQRHGSKPSKKQIIEATIFQEQYFDIDVFL